MSKMAENKKTLNYLSSNSQHHSWPNLPQQLMSLIPRQKKLLHNITSFGGVTKTWRSTPKQCRKFKCPQLVEINTKPCSNPNHKNMCSYIFDIHFDEVWPYPYYKGRPCKRLTEEGCFKGYSSGCLFYFYIPSDLSNCCISWLTRWSSAYLPPWDLKKHPFKFAAIIPSVGSSFTVIMVLTSKSSHTLASYHRPRTGNSKWEWNFQDYAVKDPYNPGKNMEFRHGIGFNGKFYMVSMQGTLVVMEEDTGISGFEITGVGKNRVVPGKMSRQYREFFVELNGELLLVFLISRKSIGVVDDIEVLRLSVSELLWVKVESLGEGTLFIEDECCMGVNAEKIGCRKNCIYFTHSRVDDNLWFVYDMEIGQIFPASRGTSDYMKWDEPIDLEDDPPKRRSRYCKKWCDKQMSLMQL